MAGVTGSHGSGCGTLRDPRPLWVVRIPTPPSLTRGRPQDHQPGRTAAQARAQGWWQLGAKGSVRCQRPKVVQGSGRPAEAPGPTPGRGLPPSSSLGHAWALRLRLHAGWRTMRRETLRARPAPGPGTKLSFHEPSRERVAFPRDPVLAPRPHASCQGPDPRDRRAVISHQPGLWEAYQRFRLPTGHARRPPALPPGPTLLAGPHELPVTHPRGSLATSWSPRVLGGAPGTTWRRGLQAPSSLRNCHTGNLLRFFENHHPASSREEP